MEIVNLAILKHPMNWVILFLMVFLAGIGLHFVLLHFSGGKGGGTIAPSPSASQS